MDDRDIEEYLVNRRVATLFVLFGMILLLLVSLVVVGEGKTEDVVEEAVEVSPPIILCELIDSFK